MSLKKIQVSLKLVLRNFWVLKKSSLKWRKCEKEKLLHMEPVQILLSQNILNLPIKNVFHIKII